MDFELTETQRLIRETARRVAREVIAPRAAEIDETGVYPEDVFQAFKETEILGMAFPEEYGGSGAGISGLVDRRRGSRQVLLRFRPHPPAHPAAHAPHPHRRH